MQMIEKTWLTRISFLLVALALVMLFTAVAQAQDSAAGKEGCIYGQVWLERNRNGIKDDRDRPIDGASVSLLVGPPFQYQVGPLRLVNHTWSHDQGTYAFCDLKTGDYEVRVKLPNEVTDGDTIVLASGSHPAGPIQFLSGGSAMVNFGFRSGGPHISSDTLNNP